MLDNTQRIVSIADANTSSSAMDTENADTLDDYEVITKLQKKKTVIVPGCSPCRTTSSSIING